MFTATDYLNGMLMREHDLMNDYVFSGPIRADEIVIFRENFYFCFQNRVEEMNSALISFMKASGKRYFCTMDNSTFMGKDMRYLLNAGAKVAGHLLVDTVDWKGRVNEDSAIVVFEII